MPNPKGNSPVLPSPLLIGSCVTAFGQVTGSFPSGTGSTPPGRGLIALDVNSDAIAYAVLQYAMNTSDVNGQRGKGNFRLPSPETPPAQ